MKIHVEGNLYILSDEKQFIIAEERTRKIKDKDTGEVTGEEQYMFNLTYHSTLQGVVKALITRKLKESTSTTLQALLSELEGIRNDVESKVFI